MKELLKTPVFTVVEKDEIKPGFRPVGLEANDWVSIIVKKDNNFLMVKQLRFGSMEETLEFPCGTVEEGEDPKVAVCRELEEETGYKVSPKDVILFGIVNPNPAYFSNHKYTYYVDLDKSSYKITKQNLDENEDINYEWHNIDTVIDTYAMGSDNDPGLLGTSLFFYMRNVYIN